MTFKNQHYILNVLCFECKDGSTVYVHKLLDEQLKLDLPTQWLLWSNFNFRAIAEFARLRKMRENAAMISALLIMFPLIMYLRKKIPQPAHTNDYSDPSHNLARTTEK